MMGPNPMMALNAASELTVADATVRCGIADFLLSIDSNDGRDAVQRRADFQSFQPAVGVAFARAARSPHEATAPSLPSRATAGLGPPQRPPRKREPESG